MTWLLFVVLWLSTYRVTRFILDDSLFAKQREWFYLRFPPSLAFATMHRQILPSGHKYWGPAQDASQPTRKISKIGELFFCYWCIGFWVSGAVVGIAELFVSIPLPGLTWCAISTLVGLTARNLDRG